MKSTFTMPASQRAHALERQSRGLGAGQLSWWPASTQWLHSLLGWPSLGARYPNLGAQRKPKAAALPQAQAQRLPQEEAACGWFDSSHSLCAGLMVQESTAAHEHNAAWLDFQLLDCGLLAAVEAAEAAAAHEVVHKAAHKAVHKAAHKAAAQAVVEWPDTTTLLDCTPLPYVHPLRPGPRQMC